MGGEPFLRGDLGEIVNTIVSFLPRVTIRINTNGFLTERILNMVPPCLSTAKKVVVNVSLDGVGKTHDEMRGVSNAYNKALSTLKG